MVLKYVVNYISITFELQVDLLKFKSIMTSIKIVALLHPHMEVICPPQRHLVLVQGTYWACHLVRRYPPLLVQGTYWVCHRDPRYTPQLVQDTSWVCHRVRKYRPVLFQTRQSIIGDINIKIHSTIILHQLIQLQQVMR